MCGSSQKVGCILSASFPRDQGKACGEKLPNLHEVCVRRKGKMLTFCMVKEHKATWSKIVLLKLSLCRSYAHKVLQTEGLR